METRTLPGASSRISRPRFCEARSVRYIDWTAERACASDTLAASEARRALLGKGRDPFRIVAGAAQLALHVAFDVELLLESVLPTAPQRVLGGGKSSRGRHGKLTRHGIDRRCKLCVLDALPDQSPGSGL